MFFNLLKKIYTAYAVKKTASHFISELSAKRKKILIDTGLSLSVFFIVLTIVFIITYVSIAKIFPMMVYTDQLLLFSGVLILLALCVLIIISVWNRKSDQLLETDTESLTTSSQVFSPLIRQIQLEQKQMSLELSSGNEKKY